MHDCCTRLFAVLVPVLSSLLLVVVVVVVVLVLVLMLVLLLRFLFLLLLLTDSIEDNLYFGDMHA